MIQWLVVVGLLHKTTSVVKNIIRKVRITFIYLKSTCFHKKNVPMFINIQKLYTDENFVNHKYNTFNIIRI